MTEFGRHKEVLGSLESLGEKLNSVIQIEEQQRANLKNSIDHIDEIVQPYKERSDVVMQNNQALRLENASLTRQLAEGSNKDINVYEKAIQRETKRNAKLRERIAVLVADNNQMAADRMKASQEYMSATALLNETHEEETRQQHITIRNQHKSINDLTNKINSLQEKLRSNQNDSKKFDNILTQCHISMEANDVRMNTLLQQCETKLENLRSQMEEQLQNQANIAIEKNKEYTTRLAKCRDMAQEIKRDMDSVSNQNKDLVKMMHEQKEESQRNKESLEKYYELKESQLARLEKNLEIRASEIEAKSKLLDVSKQQLRASESDISNMKTEVTQVLSDAQKNATKKIKELEDKINTLKSRHRDTVSKLRGELFKARTKKSSSTPVSRNSSIDQLTKQKVQQLTTEQNLQINELRRRLKAESEKINKLKVDKKKYMRAIELTKSHEAHNKASETKMNQLKRKIDQTEASNAKLLKQIEKLRNQLITKNKELMITNSELAATEARHSNEQAMSKYQLRQADQKTEKVHKELLDLTKSKNTQDEQIRKILERATKTSLVP